MKKKLKNTDFNKFIKKLVLLVVVLALLDVVIGSAMAHYYFKLKSGNLYRTTYVINETKADVLVFGSSRASHHYVPQIFEERLKLTFYNCGRDGTGLLFHLATLYAALDRYTPKHVIIDISPNELYLSEEGKLAPLLPYKGNPAIDRFIPFNSPFEQYKSVSGMYRYNSLFSTIVLNSVVKNIDFNGYMPLFEVMPNHVRTVMKQAEIIPLKVELLDKLINDLRAREVKLTLVISPSYFLKNPESNNTKAIQSLALKYPEVSFLDFENLSYCSKSEFYKDDFHLNDKGARIFSSEVAKQILLQKKSL